MRGMFLALEATGQVCGWALHRSSCGVGDSLGEWWTRVLKR